MLRLVCALVVASLLWSCSSRVSSQALTDVCGHIRDSDDRAECERRAASALARGSADERRTTGVAEALGVTWFSTLTMTWYAVYYAVGLAFAIFVHRDAKRREWRTFMIPPFWWGAACLFEPAFGALAYWVLHYSRLARHRS